MEEIKMSKEMAKNIFKNVNINVSLHGWQCTIAILGICVAKVAECKIKTDAAVHNNTLL